MILCKLKVPPPAQRWKKRRGAEGHLSARSARLSGEPGLFRGLFTALADRWERSCGAMLLRRSVRCAPCRRTGVSSSHRHSV